MSVTYGFYNSVNNDRKYNATQMSSLFDGIINDGVFMSVGDALIVTAASGMNVVVGIGRAWFNRTWTDNDSPLVLMIDPSELVLNRIDRVVLEVNSDDSVRANAIKIVKGTPASSPVAPTLVNTEFVHQYPLCNIYVGAGVTSINQGNITNKIGTSECPFVTGILETVNIDDLLLQWDAEFQVWFDSIQDILDENTAANLLNLINTHKADYVAQPANGGTTTGTSTAYVCSSSPNPSVLSDKIGIVITAHVDSGLNPTLNWGGLGAKPIKKASGAAASLKAGGVYTLRYNGTSGNFILQGEGASGNATASDLLSGKTASTDAGDIVGTLELTGNAVASNLLAGKTMYTTDPKTKVTGTMVNRAGNTSVGVNVDGTTTVGRIYLKPPIGFYDGVDDLVYADDVDFIPDNFPPTKNIFGLQGSQSYIENVQRITTTITSTTVNVTISSVDLSRSFVRVKFVTNQNSNTLSLMDYQRISAKLTSATNIQLQVPQYNSSYGTITVHIEVVTFKTGVIKSIQRGSRTANNELNPTVTISSVNISKTIVEMSWRTIQADLGYANQVRSCALTSSTQLTLYSPVSPYTNFEYEVIEFY